MKKTTAEIVSALMDDDGSRFSSKEGVRLEEICSKHGAKTEKGDEAFTYRYTFSDGSVISVVHGGWDLGYPDCWCWKSVGHTNKCKGLED